MQDIFQVIADFVAFPLPNIISLVFIISGAWWFLKLRPVEQKANDDVMNRYRKEMAAWRNMMRDDRMQIMNAIAANSTVIEDSEVIIKNYEAESLSDESNCKAIMDTLKHIKYSQDSQTKQYQNMAEKLLDIKSASAILDEKLKDIKQTTKECIKK